MENKALQHFYTSTDLDLYRPLDGGLDTMRYKGNLFTPEAKVSTSTQLDALLPSYTPLKVAPDMYTWTTQMVDSSRHPQPTITPLPDKIVRTFITYAGNEDDHKRKSANEGYLVRISKILTMLSKQICKLDCTWREIATQDQWKYEDHMERAHLILLLVDDNFINAEYCFCPRLEDAIYRHRTRAIYVVPIYLRPCLLERVPFSTIPFLPSKQRSVSVYNKSDKAFEDITKGLCPIVTDIRDRILP